MNVQHILAQRAKTHGSYDDNAHISEEIMRVLAKGSSFTKLTDVQLNALRMIAMKMSRICSGDPNEKDSWLDCAGFATLAADRIQIEHPELTFQVDTYTGIPAPKDVYKVPTGWRLMSGNDRVDALSRCHCTDGWKEFHPTMYGMEFHQWVADGYACITPDWHNPCNVESPGEGYRFLLKGEKRTPDLSYFSRGADDWKTPNLYAGPLFSDITYRTKCPLPTIR